MNINQKLLSRRSLLLLILSLSCSLSVFSSKKKQILKTKSKVIPISLKSTVYYKRQWRPEEVQSSKKQEPSTKAQSLISKSLIEETFEMVNVEPSTNALPSTHFAWLTSSMLRPLSFINDPNQVCLGSGCPSC